MAQPLPAADPIPAVPAPRPAKATYVLGISCFYHDSAAALVRDGELVAAAHEERFTRKRHDPDLPVQASRYCLEQAGTGAVSVERVDLHPQTRTAANIGLYWRYEKWIRAAESRFRCCISLPRTTASP